MKNQLLFLFMLAAFVACQPKSGNLNDFKEVEIESLNANNAPEGLELVDGSWRPGKGWELVPSNDGKQVMLLQTGRNTGAAGFECKCATGTGKCGVRSDFVMCKPDVCTDCKTVLKIYNQRVTIDRAKW